MRTTTKAMQFIEAQAQHFDLNTKQLYNKTKSLLGLYRNVVWSVKNRAADYRKEIAGTYGMQLNTALLYLADFAPDRTRDDFEAKVNNLFQSHWLIKLIDLGLKYVNDYPYYGEMYADILRLRFLDEVKRNDNTVSELLSLERSTYYDRKKEAILLLGVSLWGLVIPNAISIYKRFARLSISEDDFFNRISKEQGKQ